MVNFVCNILRLSICSSVYTVAMKALTSISESTSQERKAVGAGMYNLCIIFEFFCMEAIKMRNNGDGKPRDKLFITEKYRMKN